MIKKCKRCGQQFDASAGRYRYCSDTCSELGTIERVKAYRSKHSRGQIGLVKLTPPRSGNANWVRAKEYDEGFGEKLQSVYSPLSIIAIVRDVAECQSCHCVKPLINGYCEPCITLGANEKQVMKPKDIQARSNAGRINSANSPWRFGIGKRA